MPQQKLYTEEQVKDMFSGVMHEHHINEFLETYYYPIELPSDEEIEEQSWGYREVTKDMDIPPNEDWSNGAKWMREQILNK